MDNNPFRKNQPNTSNNYQGYMTPPTMGGTPSLQQQQQQQQQQPYTNEYTSPPPNNGAYPPPPPQQQQTWQSNNTTTPYPIQAQPTSYQPFSNPSSYNLQQQQQQPYSSYNHSSLISSTSATPTTTSLMAGGGGTFGNTTYPPYQTTVMPPLTNTYTGYGGDYHGVGLNTPNYNNGYNLMQQPQPHQQQQHQQQPFYIPANFGQSTIQQQPKHAPVDASSLLKGTQVKRVECPVCQKMIEGDDMAVNHHVNEHYN